MAPEIAVDMTDVHKGKTGRPPRKTLLATGLLTTLVLALILITQLQSRSLRSYIPQFAWSGADESHNPQTAAIITLTPEDHIYRNATTQTHHWRVTKGFRRPDGVLKNIYLTNDAFPGPTLEARSGDRLIITVENALHEEGLSIHWHGLSMRGANAMDGAVGITQSPIEPGQSFVYDFTIDQSQHGSFWWHAHEGVQRADGFYGGLVVHEPLSEDNASEVATEHLLLIGDWYHRSAEEALEFYMHPGAFGLETLPDSVLVNGVGAFRCADAVPARPVDCIQLQTTAQPVLGLDSTRPNILRVVNVGAYTGFSVATTGANFTPLTVDGGHRIGGSPSSSVGFLHPGERVDLLVTSAHVAKDRPLRLEVTLDEEQWKYENPALTTTHQFAVQGRGKSPNGQDSHTAHKAFDIQEIRAASEQTKLLPSQADTTIVLYTLTQKLARLENEPHGFINRTTWLPQSPPLIDIPRNEWNDNQLIPRVEYNETSPIWVDLVLNNLDEDSHPFHLHGHDFWVLSKYSSDYNWGSYNPFEDEKPPGGEYDLTHAVRRDTFHVPRRGYAVLRFRADNPGLWMFHCHVLWHQASGMAMAFEMQG